MVHFQNCWNVILNHYVYHFHLVFICRDYSLRALFLIFQVIEVLCQEPDPAAARQELQSQFDTVDQLYEELLNGVTVTLTSASLYCFVHSRQSACSFHCTCHILPVVVI